MTRESKETPPRPASAHLGFARKHRPQAFDDVVGQEAVSTTLKNALADKTPAHAYLFFGPRGVGKTTTARILAKALNCRKGPTPEPCGQCDACTEIAQSSAIDVLELDAATHTQVDRIREMIIETVSLAPSRDRFKIFIIDEVHMLSTASFNALLKTLEEPPAHVVFILATTDHLKIPPTIVSRCQRFRFRPLPLDLLTSHLRKLCKEEDISAEPAALELLARAAGGAMRDAVSLLEQAQAYADAKLTEENVRGLLGSLPDKMVLDLARAVLDKDAPAVARVLGRIWAEGFDAGQVLRDLRERLHAAYLNRLGVGGELAAEWRALAGGHSAETFGYLVGRINKILESLRNTDSPRLSLEQGIYGLLEAAYDLRNWLQRLDALERRLSSGNAESAAEPPTRSLGSADAGGSASMSSRTTAGAGSSVPTPRATADAGRPVAAKSEEVSAPVSGGDVWSAVLSRMEGEKPGLAQDLRSARLIAEQGEPWRLLFQREFALERARSNQDLIEATLATVSGRSIRLRLEIDRPTAGAGHGAGRIIPPGATGETRRAGAAGAGLEAKRREAGEPADWKDMAEEKPPEDPNIKKVLDIFPGKVRHVKKK